MSENLPQDFWEGVEQFNSGQFYACHDTLEALWMEASEPEKSLYQGILQIAVAFYHLGNDNLRGAMILLGEGSNRLRRYPDNDCGINVEKLLVESVEFLKVLQQTDPKTICHGDLIANSPLPLPQISIIKE
jgi:predicted metal-dependent hydrolase